MSVDDKADAPPRRFAVVNYRYIIALCCGI